MQIPNRFRGNCRVAYETYGGASVCIYAWNGMIIIVGEFRTGLYHVEHRNRRLTGGVGSLLFLSVCC